jgi:hypothetical protein
MVRERSRSCGSPKASAIVGSDLPEPGLGTAAGATPGPHDSPSSPQRTAPEESPNGYGRANGLRFSDIAGRSLLVGIPAPSPNAFILNWKETKCQSPGS